MAADVESRVRALLLGVDNLQKFVEEMSGIVQKMRDIKTKPDLNKSRSLDVYIAREEQTFENAQKRWEELKEITKGKRHVTRDS